MKNQSNSNIQRKKNTILTMSYNKEGITTPLNYHHDEKLMRISPQFKSNTKMQRVMKERKKKAYAGGPYKGPLMGMSGILIIGESTNGMMQVRMQIEANWKFQHLGSVLKGHTDK